MNFNRSSIKSSKISINLFHLSHIMLKQKLFYCDFCKKKKQNRSLARFVMAFAIHLQYVEKFKNLTLMLENNYNHRCSHPFFKKSTKMVLVDCHVLKLLLINTFKISIVLYCILNHVRSFIQRN